MREPVPSPSMPKSVASCDAPHAPRRTTRSLHTPAYLQDDKYNLTNLHSSTSVASSSHRQQHSLASLTTNHDIYVDDVILTGTDLEEIESLMSFLHDQFKIKDLGKLLISWGWRYCIGMMSFDFTKEIVSSPFDCTEKLKATDGKLLTDPTLYRKLVGKLNFLTTTKIDISYSVHYLSQFMQTPREPHLKAAYHVLKYLKQYPSLGIFISNTPAFTKSKKQYTISLSSAEAEYRAVRQVAGELSLNSHSMKQHSFPILRKYDKDKCGRVSGDKDKIFFTQQQNMKDYLKDKE
uniref:Reverse transcriptase Ty1/copia-type domain-containing protein n=1 Tax=Solanum lycopersicum TaxID=4081 RepID=A0A3Q7I591_SOLLC